MPLDAEYILKILQDNFQDASKGDLEPAVDFFRVYLAMRKTSQGHQLIELLQLIDVAGIEAFVEGLVRYGETKEDPPTLWEHLDE